MHVTHVVCDLNLQRRIADGRRAALVRSLGRKKGRRWLPWSKGSRAVPDASALKPCREDVGHALKF